jgi:rhamnosyltransferase
MTPTGRVAIVIPTRNGGPGLARLLDAIAEQEGIEAAPIVAVDSGSTDGSVDLLENRGVQVLRVAPDQFNHGDTRNLALSAVRTDLAVLTVQDAVPASKSWLVSLVRPLLDDGTIAGTYARQRPWPDASRITAHYLSGWIAAQDSSRVVGPITPAAFEALTPVERYLLCVFDNVCSCIRMSVWRSRPFRHARIAEDLEWALEVLQSGHRLAYVPEAVVWHSHDRSARYELGRTYLVHQQLQSLFGLSTIPTLGALARSIASALPLHLRLAAGERTARIRALARGVALAVAFPLGQYLGARAAREGRDLLTVDGV